MLSKIWCLVPKTYYLVLLQTISSYYHTIPNSTTIPFPILPPYHSQFYHHTIPNFTIISKSTIHCLILLHSTTISHSTIYCLLATKIFHPPTLPITTNSTAFYHHIKFYHLLPFCYKKSTIHQLYQLPLILLHSTTISIPTIYCLFATKDLPSTNSTNYH